MLEKAQSRPSDAYYYPLSSPGNRAQFSNHSTPTHLILPISTATASLLLLPLSAIDAVGGRSTPPVATSTWYRQIVSPPTARRC